MKKCPKCGLTNPDSAQRCDCGWDFHAQTLKTSHLSQGEKSETAKNKKLEGVEYLWACWPLAMIYIGGALGGLCGGAAAGINVKIFKSSKSTTYKYVASLFVSLGSVFLYFIGAIVLVLLFPPLDKH